MNKTKAKEILEYCKANNGLLAHNCTLNNIFEGDLLTYVLMDLKKQLSASSYEQCAARAAPINLLKRLIDKLSKLYSKPPKREVVGGVDKDKELIDFYIDQMDLNTFGNMSNEYFNLFKTTALEPYLDRGKARLRVLPSDRFLVLSEDPVNPLRVTMFIKFMGKALKKADNKAARPNTYDKGKTKELQNTVDIMYVYTDDEFSIIDSDGNVRDDLMAKAGNPKGVNVYKRIPFVYINRSRIDLVPKMDTDTLTMTKLVPILLSDLNFAVMFQAFSIVYGIDLDDENLKMAPNAFWRFKSDPTKGAESRPSVGVIKPEVDIDQVWNYIVSQLQMWLQSRNIRPGAIGNVSAESAMNGISKIIDEMDTSDDRQKQVPYFKTGEQELWDLIITTMHPEFQRDPSFEMRQVAFSKGVSVNVQFSEQRPLVDQSVLVRDGIQKINNRLASRRMVLKELNPDLNDEEIEEMLTEIDEESAVEMEGAGDETQGNDGGGETDPAAKGNGDGNSNKAGAPANGDKKGKSDKTPPGKSKKKSA